MQLFSLIAPNKEKVMNNKMSEQGKSAIDAGADKAKQGTDWVSDKVDSVKTGAVDLAETVQDRASTMARGFADTAKKAKDQAGQWISDNAEPVQKFVEDNFQHGREAIDHFTRDATDMVRRYPLTAVAIGLGIGLLIGRAAGNRV
jgi:ElaB/YqjD/DUF883 family membrane-anchored ribosome-binding protein